MIAHRLKTALLAAGTLLALAGTSAAQQAPPFKLRDGDRVVFYGDSITDQRLYTTFVENYVVTRFPRLNVAFVHSGWGGDTVHGGGGGPIDLRLQRDVIPYKPTVMTIMLGMNDGGYHAFDPKTFDAYSQGYAHILDTVQKGLPGLRLTLIQPSPYDDVTRAPNFAGGYNAVLVRLGQFVQEQAVKNNADVADFNAPMTAMLQKANASDPAAAQKIVPDRVHPSPGGHLVMAEALLKAWNAPSLVSSVEIDAAYRRVVRAANTKVSQLAAGKTIAWTQTDDALPLPPPGSDPVVALALQSSDFTDALDQERLRVSGLVPATRYALTIDDREVGDWTGAQLAQGVNLATLSTPMTRQAAAVADLTSQHNDQHYTRWRTLQVPLQKHNDAVKNALPLLLAALDAEEAETVAKRRAAAQPVPHRYQIAAALPDPAGPDLALHKPYASSDPNKYGWGIGGLTDGSWEATAQHAFATDDAAAFPKTVTVDLQAPATLGAVRVGVPPFGSTKTVQVSVSADGQTFTPVGSYAFSLRSEERHWYRFPPVSARYVRLTYPDHYQEEADYGPNFAFTTEVEAYAP